MPTLIRSGGGIAPLALLLAVLGAAAPRSQAAELATDAGEGAAAERTLASDIKAYFSAPLRWDAGDWAFLAGSVVAVGVAHHYDTQVRTHFLKLQSTPQSSKELQDFAPTAAVLGATWLYAAAIDNADGRREAWNMVEAAGLSSVTVYALKFAVGRQGPDETDNPNRWRKGGRSFPSEHAAAAFAVGAVLAESGGDDYRWLRRLLGYGLGAGSAYLRLKHNAHWLSDTVAGAALGGATARFVLNRSEVDRVARLGIEPVPGGALLTYTRQLP
ncbi:MAG: phosphatase PAP2 family protein [Gammaproteobacteria bacterium]|nr:phosphatase PAP2 family protein [Gammaproteobacteria bacterium]